MKCVFHGISSLTTIGNNLRYFGIALLATNTLALRTGSI